ncbi:hypothetical protein ACWDKQ_22890 [Saccharopolyspora sp. NPDC000995]
MTGQSRPGSGVHSVEGITVVDPGLVRRAVAVAAVGSVTESFDFFRATVPSTLPALFPTSIRHDALSISFNISTSLFGGTVATAMTALIAATGDLMWPAYYLIGAGVDRLDRHLVREGVGRPPAAGLDAGGRNRGGCRALAGTTS